MGTSKTSARQAALNPSSRPATSPSTHASVLPRVTLPTNLSTSLKYLDDAELQTLREAVTVEIERLLNADKGQCRKLC
jgi:hypothetical protein